MISLLITTSISWAQETRPQSQCFFLCCKSVFAHWKYKIHYPFLKIHQVLNVYVLAMRWAPQGDVHYFVIWTERLEIQTSFLSFLCLHLALSLKSFWKDCLWNQSWIKASCVRAEFQKDDQGQWCLSKKRKVQTQFKICSLHSSWFLFNVANRAGTGCKCLP